MVTDEGGNILEEIEFDAYGEITGGGENVSRTSISEVNSSARAGVNLGGEGSDLGLENLENLFVGAYGVKYDGKTNLHYMRYRWYSADQMRFLSPDLLLGINRYAYCDNNPLKYTDKLGLSGEGVQDWPIWHNIGLMGPYESIQYMYENHGMLAGDITNGFFHGGLFLLGAAGAIRILLISQVHAFLSQPISMKASLLATGVSIVPIWLSFPLRNAMARKRGVPNEEIAKTLRGIRKECVNPAVIIKAINIIKYYRKIYPAYADVRCGYAMVKIFNDLSLSFGKDKDIKIFTGRRYHEDLWNMPKAPWNYVFIEIEGLPGQLRLYGGSAVVFNEAGHATIEYIPANQIVYYGDTGF